MASLPLAEAWQGFHLHCCTDFKQDTWHDQSQYTWHLRVPGSSSSFKCGGGKILAIPQKDCHLDCPQQLDCAGVMAFIKVTADVSALGHFSLEPYTAQLLADASGPVHAYSTI